MSLTMLSQVVDRLADEQGMEGVREEVPGLLNQILGGELVMLEGLPDERIRCELYLQQHVFTTVVPF